VVLSLDRDVVVDWLGVSVPVGVDELDRLAVLADDEVALQVGREEEVAVGALGRTDDRVEDDPTGLDLRLGPVPRQRARVGSRIARHQCSTSSTLGTLSRVAEYPRSYACATSSSTRFGWALGTSHVSSPASAPAMAALRRSSTLVPSSTAMPVAIAATIALAISARRLSSVMGTDLLISVDRAARSS